MKLFKEGIAKHIPAERVPEYLAAGWCVLAEIPVKTEQEPAIEPEQETEQEQEPEAEPEQETEKPKRGRSKKEA